MDKNICNSLLEKKLPKVEETYTGAVIDTNSDNVVSRDKLMNVYLKTLKTIANYLANTFGPMGSNTKIIKGNTSDTISSEYTKDGHNVLKYIKLSNPIEMSIQAE